MPKPRPQDLTLLHSSFPRELKRFVEFISQERLGKALRRVRKKLSALSAGTRALYGDRFFFHAQLESFLRSSPRIRLDDYEATRAASLIAGANSIRARLSPKASLRFRSMIIDNLQPDRDIRELEHEIRAYVNFAQKGYEVVFADLEGIEGTAQAGGRYDLLLRQSGVEVELECKTITGDTGSQVKTEKALNVFEAFRLALKKSVGAQSGAFVLELQKPVDDCKELARHVAVTVSAPLAEPFVGDGFTITFTPRPDWQLLLDEGRLLELSFHVKTELHGQFGCVTAPGKHLMALVIKPHKEPVLAERVVQTLKKAADQCTRSRPSLIWLHFVGMDEKTFDELVRFSSDGTGGGLNAQVAQVLHPKASSTDRSHVASIWFSADPANLTTKMAIGADLLIKPAIALDGRIYAVSNPNSRFNTLEDQIEL